MEACSVVRQEWAGNGFPAERCARGMGEAEVTAFRTRLAVEGQVAAGKQNQALAAIGLHVPSIFPAHLVQRVADLPQAVGLHCLHQRGEDVLAVTGHVLQALQGVIALGGAR